MKIVIGADHRGFSHKEYIKTHLHVWDTTVIAWLDVGADTDERSDYPIYSKKVCEELCAGHADYGVLICGTGIGMAIAANRYERIYAALVWNKHVARLAKEHDHANVLVLPSDFVSHVQSIELIQEWLCAPLRGGRYQQRVDMINTLCTQKENDY